MAFDNSVRDRLLLLLRLGPTSLLDLDRIYVSSPVQLSNPIISGTRYPSMPRKRGQRNTGRRPSAASNLPSAHRYSMITVMFWSFYISVFARPLPERTHEFGASGREGRVEQSDLGDLCRRLRLGRRAAQ